MKNEATHTMATGDSTADVVKKLEEASLEKNFVEISFAGRGLKLDKAEDGKHFFLHSMLLESVFPCNCIDHVPEM